MVTSGHTEQYLTQVHRYGDARLMLRSSGNPSQKVDEKALVSGTGSQVLNLQKGRVPVCNITTDVPQSGAKPPTENTSHLEILHERLDVDVVLHFQSEYTTAVSHIRDESSNFNVTAEILCHVGKGIPVIPHYRPDSPELAKAVAEAIKEHSFVLLTNHGQMVYDKDFDQVYGRVTLFEIARRIIVRSGGDYPILTPGEIDDLETYVLGKRTKQKTVTTSL